LELGLGLKLMRIDGGMMIYLKGKWAKILLIHTMSQVHGGEGQTLQPKFPQPSTIFQPILVSFFPFSSLIFGHSFKGTLELQFLSSCCHWKGLASYFPKLIDLFHLVQRLRRYFSRKYGGSTYNLQ